MKLAWIVVLIFFMCQSTTAQRTRGLTGFNLSDHLLMNNKEAIRRMDVEDVDGSRYENDSFKLSMVVTQKDTFYDVPMKYNIFDDLVEFKDKGVVYLLDPLMIVKKIHIDKLELVVDLYEVDGQTKTGFFIPLDDGKVKLLSKKVIKFQQMQPAKALQAANTPAKFIKSPDEFYLRIGNNPAVQINKVKKAIEMFPDHQKSLLSYADRRKISVKRDELIALWAYYNSLD